MQLSDGQQLFGFRIVSADQVKGIRHAIKLLQQNQCTFTIDDQQYVWHSDYLDLKTLTTAQGKVLDRLFELYLSNGSSQGIGIIPDPIQCAYQEGLMSDQDSSYYQEQEEIF